MLKQTANLHSSVEAQSMTSTCAEASMGRAPGAEQDRNELAIAAGVTRQIRQIDSIAQGLGLAATNALLVAKRASAIGFTVVARELHDFAGTLESDLNALVRRIHALVQNLAELSKKKREMNRLCDSYGSSDVARRKIESACKKTSEEISLLQLQVKQMWHDCAVARERVEKRGKMGIVVGHSAMIEASQSVSEQQALRHIAVQVGQIVDSILHQVRELKSSLIASE